MRRLIAGTCSLGMIFGSAAAFADQVADGSLSQINEEEGTITLDTGETFVVDGTYQFADIQTGELVTIVYDVEDGKNVVSSIRTSEPNA